MVVEIIVVCILAKCRRYKLKYLFRTWTFYPILLMQLVLVMFRAVSFYGSSRFALVRTPNGGDSFFHVRGIRLSTL